MSSIVKPKISKIECNDYSGINATLNIGNTFWCIKIPKDETVSVFDEYSVGKKELENLKATLADLDTTIDEHCHDAFLVEEFNKWKEEQKVAQQKKEEELKTAELQQLANLTAEVKTAFAGTGFSFKINSYSIEVSDGTSSVTMYQTGWERKRWEVNGQETHWSSGRSFRTGEKKSSAKVANLVDIVKRLLKQKTDSINYRKDVTKTTEETDAEMLVLGWEPGCQGEYIGYNAETKQSDYKKISNNGTTYRKNNTIIYVKRVDGVIKVTKYVVEGLDINVSDFQTVKI